MHEVKITWEGGMTELKPLEYRLEESATGPWWWRKTEYAVASEFGRLSGFETKEDALAALRMLQC